VLIFLIKNYFLKNFYFIFIKWGLGIGDWGLGIGDWGLGPIPNPQSPIPNFKTLLFIFSDKNFKNFKNNNYNLYNLNIIIL